LLSNQRDENGELKVIDAAVIGEDMLSNNKLGKLDEVS
jgi:hypothetical protein